MISNEFLHKYAPLLRQQFLQYVPQAKGRAEEALREFFRQTLPAFESAPSQHDRTFALSLLFDYFDFCGNRFDPDKPSWHPLELRALLDGLPYYRQKCVYLLLADYPKDVIQNIFTVGPVLLFTALEELQQKLRERNWTRRRINLAAKQEIRRGKTPNCEPESKLASLIEGRLKWDERGRAEEHLQQCLHCLQNIVTMEEIGYFLKSLKPPDEADLAALGPSGAVGELPR